MAKERRRPITAFTCLLAIGPMLVVFGLMGRWGIAAALVVPRSGLCGHRSAGDGAGAAQV